MKATGGTVFKRHTSALDRPGGTLSLRPSHRAFCGVSVPLSFWPDSVQLIVQFLPVTHGLQAIRLVLDGASAGAVLEQAALEAAVGLGWLVVAIITMDRMANAGRADGSIEFV